MSTDITRIFFVTTLDLLRALHGDAVTRGIHHEAIDAFQCELARHVPPAVGSLRCMYQPKRKIFRWPRRLRSTLMQYAREIACDLFGLPVPQWFLTNCNGQSRIDVLQCLKLSTILEIVVGDDRDLTPLIDSFMSDYRQDALGVGVTGDPWSVWTHGEEEDHGIAWCLRFGAVVIHTTPDEYGREPFFLDGGHRNLPADASVLNHMVFVLLEALQVENVITPASSLVTENLQRYLDGVTAENPMGNHLNLKVFPPAYVPTRASATAATRYGCPNVTAWKLSYEILNTMFACTVSSSRPT